MEKRQRYCLLFVGLLCLIALAESATARKIPVGVILDLNSSLGPTVRNCINISSNRTKLDLHFRNSRGDLLTAASAAWDLINGTKVHAILGPENYEQARYVVELGKKYDVPVIWFSPSGPSLLPPRSPFSIYSSSTRSHCFQFEAIAAIIRAYNWQSVVPIYEEPDFGNDLIPCLTYALQEMDTLVPNVIAIRRDSSGSQIAGELNKINPERTYVFLAHMTVELWSRLVKHAKDKGMMSQGHAWILTQGLSSVIDPEAKDIKVKGYMDGSLGVRPSVSVRQSLNVSSIIAKRFSLARTLKLEYNKTLSLSGMWAYDTITALANAVETASLGDSTFGYGNESRVDLEDIGMRNETGPELRREILATDFVGLSGNFSLRLGQLEPSKVVVYNIVKGLKENIIGYWRPEIGLFQNYSENGEPAGKYKLRDPLWPGNTTERPPKLKIGVPKTHFTQFVDVNGSVEGQNVSSSGLTVDVFKRVVDVLPFPLPYEFVPMSNGELTPSSYNDLLCHITDKASFHSSLLLPINCFTFISFAVSQFVIKESQACVCIVSLTILSPLKLGYTQEPPRI
ncbi:glutamate receptor 2.3-like [Neltuma alba]|uniref:glutamate receptor 2.3-like n=1 Tax=Neltuma alba TaxID=207710 RepID=UPI0010A4FC5E|nr:glutamate receptor 2.3-like [Prosopis alba]